MTANKAAIDAHWKGASWNSFDSVKEAKAYFDEHISAISGVEYGIEVVSTDYWKINIVK